MIQKLSHKFVLMILILVTKFLCSNEVVIKVAGMQWVQQKFYPVCVFGMCFVTI